MVGGSSGDNPGGIERGGDSYAILLDDFSHFELDNIGQVSKIYSVTILYLSYQS